MSRQISPFDKAVGPNWRLASKRRTQKKRRSRFTKVVALLEKRARGHHARHSQLLSLQNALNQAKPGQELVTNQQGLWEVSDPTT